MSAEVFVSYRRGDPQSLELITAVESIYDPDRVFVDRSDIQPGAAFPAGIADGVRSCLVVVAIIGAGWGRPIGNGTDWVVEELNYAQQYGKPVLPVLLGVSMPAVATLPPQIQYVAYRNALAQQGTDIGHLVREIVQRLEGFGVQPRPRTTLKGSSGYAAAASWVTARTPADELSRVMGCCVAAGGKLTSRSADGAQFRFGSRIRARIQGLLTKVEDLPVDFQVRVAIAQGVTLVEVRCDEAFGGGILQEAKYDKAFTRISSLVAPK